MAVKDVINYYTSVQSQYIEMTNDSKDMEDALKNGNVSLEQCEQFKELLLKLKENYERLSYIVFLLNEPNKKEKKQKYRKENKKVYDYLKGKSTEEDVILENGNILKKLKEMIMEGDKNVK